MNGFDLDNPLSVDECLRCGFVGFECICDPARPSHHPTPSEIDAARAQRLTRRELEKGLV